MVRDDFTFEHWVDDDMRKIPDHYHAHARPVGGFFGHGLSARAPGTRRREHLARAPVGGLGRQIPLALVISLASSVFMAGVFYATQGSTNTSAADRTMRLENSTTERLASLQLGVTEKLIKLETDMSSRINKLEASVNERQNRSERDIVTRFESWEKNAEGRSAAIYALENRMTRVEAQREFNNQNGPRR